MVSCRLLYLIGELRQGGSERQLYYLLQAIDRKRCRPGVAVWRFSDKDPYVQRIGALGVPIFPLPSESTRIGKLWYLRRLANQIGAELVHSYSYHTNFAAYWCAVGTSRIGIGTIRSDLALAQNETGTLLGYLCARWPRSQIFNNSAAAKMAQVCPPIIAPRKIFVVRNGIDTEAFRYAPLSFSGAAVILSIGSLFPVKRLDRLLGAARALKKRRLAFSLKIVGDGPLQAKLEEQICAMDLADNTSLVGCSDDIPALLSSSTFLVHTSESEGLPNVIMEAMACGRAVVATDVGDVSYLVQDGVNGFLVAPDDSEALVDRIASLIKDRALCRRMGDAGRTKVEQEFGLDRLLRETFKAYFDAGWENR